jgi:hypothetical protein
MTHALTPKQKRSHACVTILIHQSACLWWCGAYRLQACNTAVYPFWSEYSHWLSSELAQLIRAFIPRPELPCELVCIRKHGDIFRTSFCQYCGAPSSTGGPNFESPTWLRYSLISYSRGFSQSIYGDVEKTGLNRQQPILFFHALPIIWYKLYSW